MPATYVETRDVPLSDLTHFSGNAKRGDVAAIQESLRRNGQYRSLIVRKTDDGQLVVLAGNHTMDALAANGEKTARCEIVTCDDAEAKRINLADNRLAELGAWDDDALAALLQSIQDDLDGTGYTGNDLDELLQSTGALGADATDFLSGFLEPTTPVPEPAPTSGAAPAAAAPAAPAPPLAAASAPTPSAPPTTSAHTAPATPAPSALPQPAPAQAATSAPQMATLQWVVTLEQRDTIRAAIKHVQASHELDTAAEALTAICRTYLDTQETPS